MFLLVGAFVYCWVACCGETVQKLGSGHKHLGYALNKLSMGFTLPILFTPQTLFCAFGLSGWLGKLLTAGGDSLGGRFGLQARLSLMWCLSCFLLIVLLCVFRWLDGLVTVVRL